ncbi:hypothetical protein GGP68_003212 [Salinibacter ruber]|uniref:DksA C4-type domain-containing protein n=1 Tax=Salinibacter ruber TaxID=146919 RepID=A0A9X2QA87_9BACT|nr:hypothetical protein [Salinibacter ruber]MCS3711563.1 hypothetical protein [Salinibacter ruber]
MDLSQEQLDSMDYLRCVQCGEETHIAQLEGELCLRCREESAREKRIREDAQHRASRIRRSDPWAQ